MLFLSRRNAFTLIELLVVIGIISILMTISIVVGSRVVSGGKARATADTIRVLDSALADYVNRVDRIPDPTVRVENNDITDPQENLYPVVDGRYVYPSPEDPGRMVLINSVGLFLYQAEGVSGISEMIATINPRFVRAYDPDDFSAGPQLRKPQQPELTTVFDAWDRPIRYVHPAFDGTWTNGSRTDGSPGTPVNFKVAATSPIKSDAERQALQITQVRRNFLTVEDREITPGLVGDSDGGICPSPRPYFYSAGEDGDPSTIDDNVYTTEPKRSGG